MKSSACCPSQGRINAENGHKAESSNTKLICELLWFRSQSTLNNNIILPRIYRADPKVPLGGGANHPEGYQHTILPNFPRTDIELRTFWAVGGAPTP